MIHFIFIDILQISFIRSDKKQQIITITITVSIVTFTISYNYSSTKAKKKFDNFLCEIYYLISKSIITFFLIIHLQRFLSVNKLSNKFYCGLKSLIRYRFALCLKSKAFLLALLRFSRWKFFASKST